MTENPAVEKHRPRAEREWLNDANLRREFHDNKDRYIRYRCAELAGLIRVNAQDARPDGPAVRVDAAAKAANEWEADPSIREEFAGDKAKWIRFRCAELNGKISIRGSPA